MKITRKGLAYIVFGSLLAALAAVALAVCLPITAKNAKLQKIHDGGMDGVGKVIAYDGELSLFSEGKCSVTFEYVVDGKTLTAKTSAVYSEVYAANLVLKGESIKIRYTEEGAVQKGFRKSEANGEAKTRLIIVLVCGALVIGFTALIYYRRSKKPTVSADKQGESDKNDIKE